MLLKLREDNAACAKAVAAGYSKKLKRLKRARRVTVSLSSAKEQLDRPDVELSLVGSLYQNADDFAKAVEVA